MERTMLEKLRLIFTLKPRGGNTVTITEKPKIEVQRRYSEFSAIEALETILSLLRTLQLDEKLQANGRPIQLKSLLASAKNTDHLSQFETSTLVFNYGAVANAELCQIIITEKIAGAAIDWEQWVAPFIISTHFVQAWVADVEYDKWQNAEDPLIYKAANRDYSSLPMRSNGLPPPVEQMVVDISKNPGRWEFRSGYIEALGSEMWLSDLFWKYVGLDHKERLAGFLPVKLTQVTDDVIHVSVSGTSFADESTRDLQDQLRSVLYN